MKSTAGRSVVKSQSGQQVLWRGLAAAVALAALIASPAWAQRGTVFKDSPTVKAAFREVVSRARQCVVQVVCDDKQVALGTVIDADGLIITKASELKDEVSCRFESGDPVPAEVLGVDADLDLALLRVDRQGLATIEWASDSKPQRGQIVATAGRSADPLALGVISVGERAIPPVSGVLGIGIDDGDGGPRITQVEPGSGAEKAGLQVDDIITHVNDKRTSTRVELIATVRSHRAGSTIRLTVKRDDKELALTATLGSNANFQDRMSGAISQRSSGFAAALQHDLVIRPNECGSPLVDLDGRVIGINVARAGRVMSYAIPTPAVLARLEDLKSGKLAPKLVTQNASQTPDDKPNDNPQEKPIDKPEEKK